MDNDISYIGHSRKSIERLRDKAKPFFKDYLVHCNGPITVKSGGLENKAVIISPEQEKKPIEMISRINPDIPGRFSCSTEDYIKIDFKDTSFLVYYHPIY